VGTPRHLDSELAIAAAAIEKTAARAGLDDVQNL